MKKTNSLLLVIFLFLMYGNLAAQHKSLRSNYVGLIPSFLVEPYDTINAIEVNFFPFLYEFRIGNENDIGFQIRPILNYRFLKDQDGFSQVGGTLVMNKYFLSVFDDDFWLKPQLGVFYTYAYNRLDEIQTMTLGIEPGAFMKISENFSLSVNLQPGVNYYPDKKSQDFVGTESGLKGHFGIIFHAGYNF
ncbi:MAG: hypothetical protein M0Q90_09095 [Bacteroidales bacterium]|nr:hypothetical protein [Bacteroidales bacterium]